MSDERAREIAHKHDHTNRCVRAQALRGVAHTDECNALTAAITAALRDAVEGERERCAKAIHQRIDMWGAPSEGGYHNGVVKGLTEAVSAIRTPE